MFKKNIGWILFVGGLLLQVLSYWVDIRIIHVLGGVLWPVGMTMCINVMIRHNHIKRNKEQENN